MASRGTDQFNSVFQDILWVDHQGQGLDTVLRQIQDGAGNATMLTIATDKFNIDTTGGGIFSINGIPYDTALPNASFITASTNSDLTNERVLTQGTGISLTDGGAGSTFTVAIEDNPIFTGVQGITLPSGTTAQRPGTPNTFELRGNTDVPDIEVYVGGTWVDLLTSSTGAPIDATYITQTPNGVLTNNQALSTLTTGLLKSTTATGVVSIAVAGTDYYAPGSTTGLLLSANNLSDVASASTSRTNLGLAIGTNVEAWSATLDEVAAGTYAGATSITTLGTITTGIWNGTTIPVADGGTGLTTLTTAYGIVCAGTTPTANLQNAGTGTLGQVLTSNGASALATWQTPTTGTVTSVSGTLNRITSTGGTTPVIDISASYVGQTSITTVGAISTGTWVATAIGVANGGTSSTSLTIHGILIGEGTSAPNAIVLTAGQVLVGTTASDPVGATLTAGTGISITNGSGSITIANSYAGNVVDQTSTTVTMAVNTTYIADNAGLVTLTLPSTAAQGSIFSIIGKGAGGWKIAQVASQQINFGNVATTSGTGGFLASSNANDCISLMCVTANTNFVVYNALGNITYN